MDYDQLTEKYRCFVPTISKIHDLVTFEEDNVNPHKMEAMRAEIQTHQDNNTWDITDSLDSKCAIRCKSVYKVKYQVYGTLERYKAQLGAT